MWVRKGVISIMDLSNDYHLIASTHEDDKNVALSNGLWFIYDHYITIKELNQTFHPSNNTIENVAISIRDQESQ